MSTAEPLDVLFEKLSAGDLRGAEGVLPACEPYLRRVVRRALTPRLRARFDSADVVQSVWAHLLPGIRAAGWSFPTTAHLRAFLVLVTRHRLQDRLRHHLTALERERPLDVTDPETLTDARAGRQPRPSEVLEADDLWERMLALCPPEHHELLRLKRQGLLLTEIAARTGLHEGSVRRIIRQLARRLACGRAGPAAASEGEDREARFREGQANGRRKPGEAPP
jgi:RNA polymerase sigma-70 factor (ECF subfamily)